MTYETFSIGDKVQTNARWDDCDLHDHMEGKVVYHPGAHPGYTACLFDSEESSICMRNDLIELVAPKPAVIPCSECGGHIWRDNSYFRDDHKSTCSRHEDYVAPKPAAEPTLREEVEHVNRLFGPKCKTCSADLPDGGITGYCADHKPAAASDILNYQEPMMRDKIPTKPDRRAELRAKYRHLPILLLKRDDIEDAQTKAELYNKKYNDAVADINELLDMLEEDPHEKERMRLSGVVLQQCHDIGNLKTALEATRAARKREETDANKWYVKCKKLEAALEAKDKEIEEVRDAMSFWADKVPVRDKVIEELKAELAENEPWRLKKRLRKATDKVDCQRRLINDLQDKVKRQADRLEAKENTHQAHIDAHFNSRVVMPRSENKYWGVWLPTNKCWLVEYRDGYWQALISLDEEKAKEWAEDYAPAIARPIIITPTEDK